MFLSRLILRAASTVAAFILVWAVWATGDANLAWARSQQELPYETSQVWSIAVRLLRVEQRYPILEKDKESGYILFDYVEGSKVYKASLELMAYLEPSGRSATKVFVNVSDLPRHVESALLEKLVRKTRDELGTPLPAPPPRSKEEREKREDAPAQAPRKAKGDKSRAQDEEDPNQPVRGEDGLPRLPTRDGLPRLQD